MRILIRFKQLHKLYSLAPVVIIIGSSSSSKGFSPIKRVFANHAQVSDVDERPTECTETGGSFQESYQNLVQTSLLFRHTLQKPALT